MPQTELYMSMGQDKLSFCPARVKYLLYHARPPVVYELVQLNRLAFWFLGLKVRIL